MYRAILDAQPRNAIVNHNLGILTVSRNNMVGALPYLKAALEADPQTEQYWLSYVDVLIKAEMLDAANNVINKCSEMNMAKEGMTGLIAKYANKLNRQESRAAPREEHSFLESRKKIAEQARRNRRHTNKKKSDRPPQKKLKQFMKLFNSGCFDEAKAAAEALIRKYPNNSFGWKMLGAVHKRLGKYEESIAASEKAAELEPEAEDIRFNLGLTFQAMGNLEKAVENYQQAIRIKNHFFDPHYNLGTVLKNLNRLDEAESSYRRSLQIQPKHVEAHNNLAITLQALGRLDEAEETVRIAIALKPDYAKAYNILGLILLESNRLEEAEGAYRKAIELEESYAEAMLNLSLVLEYDNKLDESAALLEKVVQESDNNYRLKAAVNLALFRFMNDDFRASEDLLKSSAVIQEMKDPEFRNDRIFQRFVLKLMELQGSGFALPSDGLRTNSLFVIGESHALVSHRNSVESKNGTFIGKSFLIKGCKQWDLGSLTQNRYKTKFEKMIGTIPARSTVLLAIGEIDCRLDSGIMRHKRRHPEKELEDIVATTVNGYLEYINKVNAIYQHKITIQGVPCPNVPTSSVEPALIEQLIELIRLFNVQLKAKSNDRGFGFLDVHSLTDRGDGYSNKKWHIDSYHISPEAMRVAWKDYAYL